VGERLRRRVRRGEDAAPGAIARAVTELPMFVVAVAGLHVAGDHDVTANGFRDLSCAIQRRPRT